MIKIFLSKLVILLCLNCSINVYAQHILSGVRYQLGTSAYLSEKIPFWMRAGQYGLVPLKGSFVSILVNASKEYDSTKVEFQKIRKFGFGYGTQVGINAGKHSQILLPEAYVKLRYGVFEFYAGRRKEIVGLVDTTLSAGSYIWSGNALPLPKIQISIPNYASIIGNGLISIKGMFAHGWFGKQAYTEGYYLHQKWLYSRIGRESWKVNLFAGINHQVQWGGYSEVLKNNNISTNDGYFSADPFVYLNVILPIPWKIPKDVTYTAYETLNRFGNHLGSIDLGISFKTPVTDIYFYRQTPYEDGQMPEVILSMDGNYSIIFDLKDKRQFSKISFGYLDTRRQGGQITNFAKWLGKKETHYGEVQNYFNHGQYLEGWSYRDNGIGTPLIISSNNLLITSPYELYSIDNRIQSYFFAATGKIMKYEYILKSSFIKSLGIFGLKREKSLNQFSSSISVSRPLSKLNLDSRFNIGFDSGKLYGNNIGINFSILKKW
ncbi:capsule assembly Wzi family protein [Emticicia sp. C21]|uniref:capsule assembly Wzi family protein n=1 Tax=Emticicia sp. C21 TaxID=2302915 RepID=UPI000E3474C3|nr:capsule assembly Wzi family protein [Emticicia sp. C21]RFS17223.1 hypothetical protein D0T08_05440 [Emticicia sp. C21]